MKILVVDDSEMNLEMTAEILREMGAEVDTAVSAAEAFRLLLGSSDVTEDTPDVTGQEIGQEYGLILMDYRMPEMNGDACTRLIRCAEKRSGTGGHLRILGISGDADDKTTELLLGSGMDGTLEKPLRMEQLMEELVTCGILQQKPKEVACLETEQDSWLGALRRTAFDPERGVKLSGSVQLYHKHLTLFVSTAEEQIGWLLSDLNQGNIKAFTIRVHALKSTARGLGNRSLSDQFASLEAYGDLGNVRQIRYELPDVIRDYREAVIWAKSAVEQYSPKKEKRELMPGQLREMLMALSEILEAYDLDSADMVADELEEFALPSEIEQEINQLKNRIADVDYTGAGAIVKGLLNRGDLD